jgi:hypothetical protein
MLLLVTGLALRLRDLNRGRLRMRGAACQLHCRQSRCGKQHETKFCHDGPNPPGRFSAMEPKSRWTDQLTVMGPHCGTHKNRNSFYFEHARG